MQELIKNVSAKPGFKAAVVGLLILILNMPMSFVNGLIYERQTRAEEAKREVGHAWGGRRQNISGPFLIIPYKHHRLIKQGDERVEHQEQRYAVFLPQNQSIDANLSSDVRYRGIYEVPTYRAAVTLSGDFLRPDMTPYLGEKDEAEWDKAFISLSLSDNRGIKNAVDLVWGEAKAQEAFEPGPGLNIVSREGLHAPLQAGDLTGTRSFTIDLKLNGSEAVRFIPLGRKSDIHLTSDWPHPSFQGNFLPSTRTITKEGFSARWQIPELARSFPQSWSQNPNAKIIRPGNSASNKMANANPYSKELWDTSFGADFFPAVDFYQKIMRSTKYAILFFGFTFLAFFLYEILTKARIHIVQYLMVGVSQCIFYLLLLSLSEHIGFLGAYLIASGANIGLVTFYIGSVLRNRLFAGSIFGILVVIYALLFSLLQISDYALLFGSIASFIALAAAMFLTRNVKWGKEESSPHSNQALDAV